MGGGSDLVPLTSSEQSTPTRIRTLAKMPFLSQLRLSPSTEETDDQGGVAGDRGASNSHWRHRSQSKIDPAAKKFAPTTALNHLRDSHPAYECCGCICKREKVQRFARIISSKICSPRCASICGVSACVFVYK